MRSHPRTRPSAIILALIGSILEAGCNDSTDPGASLRFEPLTETNVTTIAGAVINPAPTVRVTDRSGGPVPGIDVSFIPENGGEVENQSATTDSDGRATAGAWRLGTVARTYRLRVQASGLNEIVFTAVAAAGPATSIFPYTADRQPSGDRQTANTGEPLPRALRVVVTDANGNRLSNVPVTFEVLSGGGSISPDPVQTDVLGVARSGPWTLGTVPGRQEVRARIANSHAVFRAIACNAICQSLQLLFAGTGGFYRTQLGGGITQVSGSLGDYSPAVSPDGRRIAFVRSEGIDEIGSVYVMNIDGSNARRLVQGAYYPSWAPDGRRLVVVMGVCYCDLFTVDADDNSPPIFIGTKATEPAWSPDGARIAFVSLSGDGGNHELHVMNVDGTGIRVVSPRDSGFIGGPSWSPDGTRLAFVKCLVDKCDIHVAHADGSLIRRLTTTGNAREAAWSPDGLRIAMSLFDFTVEWSSIAWVDAQNGGDPNEIVADGWSPVWLPLQSGPGRVSPQRD